MFICPSQTILVQAKFVFSNWGQMKEGLS